MNNNQFQWLTFKLINCKFLKTKNHIYLKNFNMQQNIDIVLIFSKIKYHLINLIYIEFLTNF